MNQNDLGKVLVLMGGTSAERDISLESGRAVYQALLAADVDVSSIDVGADIVSKLINSDCEQVFIALHGRGGEDGKIQAVLEMLGLPYTGSGVLGSALSMDKIRTKQIWRSEDLPTPAFRVCHQKPEAQDIEDELGWPVMVKPSHEGSSIGISKVDKAEDLFQAWQLANQYDDDVLIESWIGGGEYTVPILKGLALPMIKLETPRDFYDYEAKYQSDDTQYLYPCGLGEDQQLKIQAIACQAFAAVGGSGWGRVDLMLDGKGQAWLIEVNTVPGMTSHSLVPMSAAHAGIDFTNLVLQIMSTAVVNKEERPQ